MKKLCIVFIALFLSYNMIAQDNESVEISLVDSAEVVSLDRNTKMSNFGFNMGLGSFFVFFNTFYVNFEGRLVSSSSNNFHLYGNIGGGHLRTAGIIGADDRSTGGIIALTMLTGKDKHYFEINTGIFLGRGSEWRNWENNFNIYPVAELGYRYQKLGRDIQ